MNIYGKKVVLRAVEEKDNEMLREMINDPETESMLGGTSWPVSRADQLKWYNSLQQNKDTIRCIITTQNNDAGIGTIILNEIDGKNGTGHIHIKMTKGEARRKGYAEDAINSMVEYAFGELRLNCIYAYILAYNDPSIKLFEKCGFHHDGVLRERVFRKGQYFDQFAYSKLASDQD